MGNSNSKNKNEKSEFFTKQEIEAIKKELLRDKARMLEELMKMKGDGSKSLKDASGDLSGYSIHMADMATDLYDREFSLGLAEGERKRLYEIESALKRIEEGTYGVCDACGDAISRKRLKAMPQAELCIKCQEKQEKKPTGK